ncbi:MAG: HD domain-containing protein [Candidatus Muiribacteriota bacterium]
MNNASKLARVLCRKHKIDFIDEMGEAARLHDIARGLKKEELQKIIDLKKLLPVEKNKVILWHAPAGAEMLKQSDFFSDSVYKFIYAVRYHTLYEKASEKNLPLKILCISDFAEYTRQFKEAKYIREAAYKCIDEGFKLMVYARKKFRK